MNANRDFELRKFVAAEFVFGAGTPSLLGRYAKNFGARKAPIVTDPGIVEAGMDSFARKPYPFDKISDNPARQLDLKFPYRERARPDRPLSRPLASIGGDASIAHIATPD